MALTAASDLVPDPDFARRPLRKKPLKFDVDVFDDEGGEPAPRTVQLTLAGSNDLLFEDGSKVIEMRKKIGARPVKVTFDTKISGTGDELGFFRVTLRDDAGDEVIACVVRLE